MRSPILPHSGELSFHDPSAVNPPSIFARWRSAALKGHTFMLQRQITLLHVAKTSTISRQCKDIRNTLQRHTLYFPGRRSRPAGNQSTLNPEKPCGSIRTGILCPRPDIRALGHPSPHVLSKVLAPRSFHDPSPILPRSFRAPPLFVGMREGAPLRGAPPLFVGIREGAPLRGAPTPATTSH